LAEGFLNCNTAASATGESRGKKESLQAFNNSGKIPNISSKISSICCDRGAQGTGTCLTKDIVKKEAFFDIVAQNY